LSLFDDYNDENCLILDKTCLMSPDGRDLLTWAESSWYVFLFCCCHLFLHLLFASHARERWPEALTSLSLIAQFYLAVSYGLLSMTLCFILQLTPFESLLSSQSFHSSF